MDARTDRLVGAGLVVALGPIALLGGWKLSEYCCSPTTITNTIVVTETAPPPLPATIMVTSTAGERGRGHPGRRTLTVVGTPEGAPPAQVSVEAPVPTLASPPPSEPVPTTTVELTTTQPEETPTSVPVTSAEVTDAVRVG